MKDIFVKPKKKFYIGKLKYGAPYFYPRNFISTILSIRRLKLRTKEEYEEKIKTWPYSSIEDKKFYNYPVVRRSYNKIIKIFNNYFFIQIGYPFAITKYDLGWKSKWDTPRFEFAPSFQIYFLFWQFCIFWNAPDGNNSLYYEMYLWYKNFHDKNIIKAKETWSWKCGKTNISTWNDLYILK